MLRSRPFPSSSASRARRSRKHTWRSSRRVALAEESGRDSIDPLQRFLARYVEAELTALSSGKIWLLPRGCDAHCPP
eukprot:4657407-Prymnesium_polylepis.1